MQRRTTPENGAPETAPRSSLLPEATQSLLSALRRQRTRAGAPPHPDTAISVKENGGVLSLHLGSDSVQSAMRCDDPWALELAYTRALAAFLLYAEPPERTLMIGLGGGSLAKFFYRYFPYNHTTVVELLPAVVAAARQLFFLPPDDERLEVILGEGEEFLKQQARCSAPGYDVIVLDAFGPEGPVTRLASEDFYARCRAQLNPNGVLLVNLWGSDRRFDVYRIRLERVFPKQTVFLPVRGRGNVAVWCFAAPLLAYTNDALRARARELMKTYPLEFSAFLTDLQL